MTEKPVRLSTGAGAAYTLKTVCPYCKKDYFIRDPLEKPLWLCLFCGRIYKNENDASGCICRGTRLKNQDDQLTL